MMAEEYDIEMFLYKDVLSPKMCSFPLFADDGSSSPFFIQQIKLLVQFDRSRIKAKRANREIVITLIIRLTHNFLTTPVQGNLATLSPCTLHHLLII